jgi:hypothetical protein
MKTRLQALALLDRALAAMTDEELEALIATLPEDHREALDKVCGAREEGGFEDPAARTLAIRATAARGRMSGALEQITTVLTDPALAECIEKLGDHADNPTEDELKAVTPDLIEHHGIAAVRLMLAASIAGEAAASVMLTRLLKHDEELGLPPEPEPAPAVVLTKTIDEETRARRKAAKERKQAEARLRREQQARARSRD